MKTLRTVSEIGRCFRCLCSPQAIPILTLVAASLFAGCASAPAEPKSMVDTQVDFGNYRTFGWFTEGSADGLGEPTSLVDTIIREAIATEMQRKGYEQAPEGSSADLLIDYQAARTEKVKSSPFRIGVGIGGYGSSGGASVSTSTSGVRNVSEGSLVIHAIDPSRNAEVWRSRVSRELGKGTVKPEVVQSVVAEVFSDFPARAAAP